MTHQVDAVKKCLSMQDGGFLNLSEPGTGKTLATIAALNWLASGGHISKVLIICPNNVKNVWKKELAEKNAFLWDVTVLDGHAALRLKTLKYAKAPHQVFITNYESVAKLGEAIKTWDPDVVVLDEAHLIKNHKSARTKAIKKIKATYRWALTGTPIVQNPLDVWSVVDWSNPGTLLPNYYAFRAKHCIIYSGAGFPMIKGYRNLGEIKSKLDPISFTALKSQCLDLPEKSWQIREIVLSPNELLAYRSMAEDMLLEIGDREVSATTALVKLLRLQQITGGFVPGATEGSQGVDIGSSKVEALMDILDELEGHKVVVWCRFRDEIRKIVHALQKAKRDHVVFMGDTSGDDRLEAIKTFQREDGKNTVFVGTIQTGGVGITLTQASYMVYYSNTWSLADRIQSEDRIHRIGQKNSCVYYDLIVKGTVDARVHKILKSKNTLASTLRRDDLKNMIFDVD